MLIDISEKPNVKPFNYVVGPLNATKLIMNPSLKELQDYGVTWLQNEPVYKNDEQFIIDFWYKIEPFTYKDKTIDENQEIRNIRFYIKPEIKKSQSGNSQYVNVFGNFSYAESIETLPSWLEKEGIREAFDGEESLYKFIASFAELNRTDKFLLNADDVKAGKFNELKNFIKSKFGEGKVKILHGLSYNEDKNRFNSITYTKYFWRYWATNISINGAGGREFKSFEEGIPMLLDEPYNDFKKSVLHPGIPMILSNSEVQQLADMPNKSDEINESTALEKQIDDLPF